MSDRVLIVCASRDRCFALDRMITSVLNTSENADIAVYLDDDQVTEYPSTWDPRVHVHVGPQIGPCKSLNRLIELHPGFVAYGAATDDCEFLTPGWDAWAIRTARNFPGGVGGFHPFLIDAKFDQRMDFPWVTGRWIEVMGWLCHAAAYHYYWDVLVELIAEEVGLVRATRSEFAIEHDGVPTPGVHEKTIMDARFLLPVIANERRGFIAKLKEAACQPAP